MLDFGSPKPTSNAEFDAARKALKILKTLVLYYISDCDGLDNLNIIDVP
jgi:hypothetical protein